MRGLQRGNHAYLVAESNSVDRAQMMIVFLDQLSAPSVVLDNLLVGHTRQKLMGCAWINADNMRRLSSGEFVEAFSCLCIPQLHVAIVAGRDELGPTGVEVDVVHGLVVAGVGPQELPLMIHIPQRNLRISRGGEK